MSEYGTAGAGFRHHGGTVGRIRVKINNGKKVKLAYIEPKQRS
jgi:hypothetical protein